jgi:NAD(P)-dependent dehydrogenase (short-subunit alcohol dehydrogenase family)
MARFTDKTAFVTGGTSGIGRATVERLIAEGARVVTTGREPHGVARVQAELGEAARVLTVDVLDLDAQRRTVDEAAGILGGIDVAVLNAGVSDWRPVDAWDEAAFDRVFDVNVKAPFFALQALLPHLRPGASVVFTASNAAHGGFAGGSVYGASKAAVSVMARSLSADLMGRGVRVNAVSPGPTDTALFAKLGIPAGQHDAAMREVVAGVPAGRLSSPAEVAGAIAFLASDEAAFAHGTDLVIDGGVTRLHGTEAPMAA